MKAGALLLAVLLLAGCFGGGEPAPAATVDDALAPAADAPTAPRPDGREGGFAAFNETNRTEEGVGGLDHAHDYWAGRARVPLLERDVGLTTCCHTTKPMAVATIRPDAGLLVYEGAGQVEVTLSEPVRRACTNVYDPQRVCTDRAKGEAPDARGAPGVHLWVRDASAKEYTDLGEVTWGTPMVIPVTEPTQTDMPHAVGSLWSFQVRSEDPADDTLRFRVRAEAVRAAGAEIPRWPGHPDFYAETPTRVVLETRATTREVGPLVLLDSAGVERQYVPADKLVSYGTRTLDVYVNITGLKVDNPALQPTQWALWWHNASAPARGVLTENANLSFHMALPVDENGMDSPYAEASRWGFLVTGYFVVGAPTPAGDVWVLGCSGLCASYEMTYDIRVVASPDAREPDAYAVPPS